MIWFKNPAGTADIGSVENRQSHSEPQANYKEIVLGSVVLLVGLSVLYGNVSHSAYGFMTAVAAVFVLGGLYAIVKEVRKRRK